MKTVYDIIVINDFTLYICIALPEVLIVPRNYEDDAPFLQLSSDHIQKYIHTAGRRCIEEQGEPLRKKKMYYRLV